MMEAIQALEVDENHARGLREMLEAYERQLILGALQTSTGISGELRRRSVCFPRHSARDEASRDSQQGRPTTWTPSGWRRHRLGGEACGAWFAILLSGSEASQKSLAGVALVAVGGVLAGALSLAIWTHIDRVVLGSVEPIEVGALYAVAAPSGVPARAVFWSEPVSSVTGACRVHASPAASHIDDRNFLLQQLNWHPRATPAPPPPPDDDQSEDEPVSELSPCQLDA